MSSSLESKSVETTENERKVQARSRDSNSNTAGQDEILRQEFRLMRRKILGILNKVTESTIDVLCEQLYSLLRDHADIYSDEPLKDLVYIIHKKAVTEPLFTSLYAEFAMRLSELVGEHPSMFHDRNKHGSQRKTFKQVLVSRCNSEFQSMHFTALPTDPFDRTEVAVLKRDRMIGNIRFIGELYNHNMLREVMIVDWFLKLLVADAQNPHERDIEALCNLLRTIGSKLDHPDKQPLIDGYFALLEELSTSNRLSRRMQFMCMDVIDLRQHQWKPRMKIGGY